MPRISYEDVPTEEVEDWVRSIVREEIFNVLNDLFIDLSKQPPSLSLRYGDITAIVKRIRDDLPK